MGNKSKEDLLKQIRVLKIKLKKYQSFEANDGQMRWINKSWVNETTGRTEWCFECSVCRGMTGDIYGYCPICGAKRVIDGNN